MSRIGRIPVNIPAKVKVAVQENRLTAEGPKGKLDFELPQHTSARIEGTSIVVARENDEPRSKALHGLSRAIINNMVKGVSEGFTKRLEVHGVGFKAAVSGQSLTMNLGYSHPIVFSIPSQIKITVEENTKIMVEGPDRQLVGQVAAEIRGFYPPEPYKGKGVRYSDEKVVRKEGKTVQ